MKVLILGMGNPILTDDAVGLAIARSLKQHTPWADVACTAVVGLQLLDVILGYDAVFIIDAMTTSDGDIGAWRKIEPEGPGGTLHLFSSHGIDIFALMEFGAECGFDMPRLVAVYGIEIGTDVAFGDDLTPALKQKLPAVTAGILADLTAARGVFKADDRFVGRLHPGVGI